MLLLLSATIEETTAMSAESIKSIDWSTVFEVLLGAFVGFFSTGITNWMVKRLQVHKLTKKISLEVKCSLQGLQKISEDDVNLYKMASPIWDVIPTSSVLLDLPTKKYLKLITMYMEVKKYNQEEESAQRQMEQGKLVDMSTTIERRKRLISVMKDNQF